MYESFKLKILIKVFYSDWTMKIIFFSILFIIIMLLFDISKWRKYMNRSASCIQMLLLLKARGFMTRKELADELQTNIRNIGEYRKELEEAGYTIISTSGKFGGYRLDDSSLIPVIGFDKEEYQSLLEAVKYMKSHQDFLMFTQYQKAMDKILSTSNMKEEEGSVYVKSNAFILNSKMKNFIMRINTARKEHFITDILYKGMHDQTYEKVRICPYELLNDKGSYYCLAYSLKAKDFRNFKFSEERMKDVQVTTMKFQRDQDFKLSNHIGVQGIMQNEVYEIDVILHDEQALLVSEKVIGIHPIGEWIDATTYHLSTLIEGKIATLQFLLSCGNKIEIKEPTILKEELKEIIEDMLQYYHL